MKKTKGNSFAAALAVAAACLSFTVAICNADQSEQEITSILTSGLWHFAGQGWAGDRNFKPDGTFSMLKHPNGSGTWKIVGDTVELHLLRGANLTEKLFLPIDAKGTNGVDAVGHSFRASLKAAGATGAVPAARQETPEEIAAPTPPISEELQQRASQAIQAHHDSLVFITGAEGSGSGFIAAISGDNYLVTNVHVAAEIRDAAFKTLDGAPVRSGALSMAVGEDIFCAALPPGGKPFEIMQNVDANAAVGDDVVVLGNAEGAGVVKTIVGKIVGIGPNLVEVDAPFVPGNSGSPIIHLKTGKVIGVATYLVVNQYDLSTNRQMKQPIIRRFGYRLDAVRAWQQVNWQAFSAQAIQMQSIETLTDDLDDFFRDISENNGGVTAGRHTNPVIKDRIDEWVTEKGNHPSAEDAAEADARFLSFLKVACQTDIAAAQREITYDYFVRELADQKATRDQMMKAFQQIIQGLGQ